MPRIATTYDPWLVERADDPAVLNEQLAEHRRQVPLLRSTVDRTGHYDDRTRLAREVGRLADAERLMGSLRAAMAHYDESIELFMRLERPNAAHPLVAKRAYALALAGNAVGAADPLTNLRSREDDALRAAWGPNLRIWEAAARLRMGQSGASRELLADAIALLRSRPKAPGLPALEGVLRRLGG